LKEAINVKLNATDIQILSHLTKHPKATFKEIAQEISNNGKKIHPSTIFRRVNRLKDLFTLKPFFKPQNQLIPYFIGLEIATSNIADFLKDFENCPRVTEIHRLSGKFNILMKMVFKDQRGITLCVDRHLRVNPAVKDITLCASSMPITPSHVYLQEITLKNPKEVKTAPCGDICSKCPDYDINCLGCPATALYKQNSFPISESRS
jgi:DNA-binding Lrp family transcriptional regulator